MARIQDAAPAKYLVAAEYSEWEASFTVFLNEDAARAEFNKHKANHTEVYLCQIMEQSPWSH